MNELQRESVINELEMAAQAIEQSVCQGVAAQTHILSVLHEMLGGLAGYGGIVALLDGREREAVHRLWEVICEKNLVEF